MELYNLIVETTRRCNMKCAHCLRGEPQNKSMSRMHLVNFLRQINYVSSVAFTGGEPTLPSGLKVINEFMEIGRHLDIEVGNFYIVTNAKVWRNEIPDTLAKLWEFCCDNDISSIDISNDQYHDPIGYKRRDFQEKLKEYLWQWYGLDIPIGNRTERLLFQHVRMEGRGVDLGAYRENEQDELMIDNWDGEYHISEGDIYLNCDGNVINGCDWSYESQKEPCNIICAADEDFETAVKKVAVPAY